MMKHRQHPYSYNTQQIHDRPLFWLGSCISINKKKDGGVKLDVRAQASPPYGNE
jgi:hypothetical protein